MNHNSYFMTMLTDEVVWEHMLLLLKKYDPMEAEKHAAYTAAVKALAATGADAVAFEKAVRSATISDAIYAFQKGLEANIYHFHHPYIPSFVELDFCDMFQEHIMVLQPKRVAAEKVIEMTKYAYFREDEPWCETINEYIVDLEVIIPKVMHFEGYKAGNAWFKLTVPGYMEDHALTSIYSMQIHEYFGK